MRTISPLPTEISDINSGCSCDWQANSDGVPIEFVWHLLALLVDGSHGTRVSGVAGAWHRETAALPLETPLGNPEQKRVFWVTQHQGYDYVIWNSNGRDDISLSYTS